MRSVLGQADDATALADVIRDPVRFCRGLLRQDLWPLQEDILRAVACRSRVAVKACHASGKTFVAAVAVLWFVTRYRDGIVVTTAPTWTQVEKLLWGEIHRAVQASRIAFPQLNKTELRLGPRNYAIGLSTNEGVRFQGFHGRVLIVVDEAPGVKADIWEAIEGIRAGGDVRVLALGNPTIASGPFHDAFTSNRDGWGTFTISAFDSPNLDGLSLDDLLALPDPALDHCPRPYLVTRRWVREKYAEWGPGHPLWEARVLGQFPTQAEDALISLSWLEEAARRTAGDRGGRLSAGLDVAGPGEDETVLVIAEGGGIIGQHAWADHDPRGAVVAALAPYRHRLDVVNVDAAGIGYYLAKHLQDVGYPVRPVNVAERSSDRERYANLKAEFYWGLRQRFQAGDVAGLTDERTIGQLAGIRYRHTARGQVEIERKEDARKRGVNSPDRAEAVMLAFARPAVAQLLFADEAVDSAATIGAPQPASWVEQIVQAMPAYFDRGVAANPAQRCGICANRTADGWCRLRQFTVTPALPACEFYEPIPASRFGPGT
jgi:phage terminase large subunit